MLVEFSYNLVRATGRYDCTASPIYILAVHLDQTFMTENLDVQKTGQAPSRLRVKPLHGLACCCITSKTARPRQWNKPMVRPFWWGADIAVMDWMVRYSKYFYVMLLLQLLIIYYKKKLTMKVLKTV